MEEDIQKALEVQNNTAMSSIADSIESRIFTIRGKQVMIDRDLAELYGVETKALNQTVKRNLERFPEDFMFQLTHEECLRSMLSYNARSAASKLDFAVQ